ncbi:unnamed protein product [Echinostoma caproni]|uniref:UDP-N-acetylglucosamine transferase subunit ALG14 n=1 Tax=Echinostoma caproni TaxID=27848 RepID=A0A183A228_9TREM|nr:unnamed protein product [Echinostoma caproni]
MNAFLLQVNATTARYTIGYLPDCLSAFFDPMDSEFGSPFRLTHQNYDINLYYCDTLLGGHTAEMVSYVRCLSDQYSPRIYAVANTDTMSEFELRKLEENKNGKYFIERIPRAREVKQSYVTSIFTTVWSALYSILLVIHTCPRLVSIFVMLLPVAVIVYFTFHVSFTYFVHNTLRSMIFKCMYVILL